MIRCTDNECWLDPRRIFNQDEKSLTAGSELERVLAPVGYQRPVYHLSGDSRDHTSSFESLWLDFNICQAILSLCGDFDPE